MLRKQQLGKAPRVRSQLAPAERLLLLSLAAFELARVASASRPSSATAAAQQSKASVGAPLGVVSPPTAAAADVATSARQAPVPFGDILAAAAEQRGSASAAAAASAALGAGADANASQAAAANATNGSFAQAVAGASLLEAAGSSSSPPLQEEEAPVHSVIARMREAQRSGRRPAGRRHLAQVTAGSTGSYLSLGTQSKPTHAPAAAVPNHTSGGSSVDAVKAFSEQQRESVGRHNESEGAHARADGDAKDEIALEKKPKEDSSRHKPHHSAAHHHRHHHQKHHHQGHHADHHRHLATPVATPDAQEVQQAPRHLHHRLRHMSLHSHMLHILILLLLLSVGVAGIGMLVKLWREEILKPAGSAAATGRDGLGPAARQGAGARAAGGGVPQRADGLVSAKMPSFPEKAWQQDSG
eukprot:TRINITY_DN33638_c0_g1_i1.p1 TRINITY_DN33638_c0_g1~~TRINITY_DN33638_c0_g1_i1.p1  ORF type:complete len:414 (+),score=91.62 TRINITY_DN33638_c0_g1_i1:116-1357(+)